MENELTPFELERLQIIARNRARLLALGIPDAVSSLQKLAPAAQPKKPRQPKPSEPLAPSRQSGRLQEREMIARGEVPPDVEPGSELALFIIDGECPRCGKLQSTGHAKHLQSCKGPPAPPTEEDIAAKAAAYKSTVQERLKELELGGLVQYNPGRHQAGEPTAPAAPAAPAAGPELDAAGGEPQQLGPPTKRQRGADETVGAAAGAGEQEQEQQEQEQQEEEQQEEEPQPAKKGRKKPAAKKKAAKGKKGAAAAAAANAASGVAAADADDDPSAIFIVVGSTGNHYQVKFAARRTCTCMDHRIRRRDCKHIRLIWQQLGVTDKPSEWEQALACKVSLLAAADPADVQMVRQAEERAQARKAKAAAAAQAE